MGLLRLRTRKVHYKSKPQHATSSASRHGPVNPRTTAAPKKSGFTDRLKRFAGTAGPFLRYSPALLSGALSGAFRHFPDMIANAVPSLSTVLGQPKLLLGVGLCLFVAYEALKI